jgi:8-oxo-dGTP diphosphatase
VRRKSGAGGILAGSNISGGRGQYPDAQIWGKHADVKGCAAADAERSKSQMTRAAIRREVASIQPFDELEEIHRVDTLAWIDSGASLFRTGKPATPPKHLVSYFAVVDGCDILLVDHKSAQLWLPPGGHVEVGEHPRETVARELFEELGFVAGHDIAAPLMITCTTTVGSTAGHIDVSLWYVVTAPRTQPIKYDAHEFAQVRWFPYAEVPLQQSDPHLGRFLAKLSSHNRVERSE